MLYDPFYRIAAFLDPRCKASYDGVEDIESTLHQEMMMIIRQKNAVVHETTDLSRNTSVSQASPAVGTSIQESI